jgi:hypothetical protein
VFDKHGEMRLPNQSVFDFSCRYTQFLKEINNIIPQVEIIHIYNRSCVGSVAPMLESGEDSHKPCIISIQLYPSFCVTTLGVVFG